MLIPESAILRIASAISGQTFETMDAMKEWIDRNEEEWQRRGDEYVSTRP